MATTTTWIDAIGEQLRGVGAAFWAEVQERGVTPFLQPVPPYDQPGFLAPVVAMGGLLGLALFSGMAVASMGALVLALFGLYLLLVEIFGLRVELAPFGAR